MASSAGPAKNDISPMYPQSDSLISSDGSIEIRAIRLKANEIIDGQMCKLEVLQNGQQICLPIPMRNYITSLAFLPNGEQFIVGSHNHVELRDTRAPLRVYWSSQFEYANWSSYQYDNSRRVDRLLFSSNAKQIAAVKEADRLVVGHAPSIIEIAAMVHPKAPAIAGGIPKEGSPEEALERQKEQEEYNKRQEEFAVIYDTQNGKKICELKIGQDFSRWNYTFRRDIVLSSSNLFIASGDKKGTVNFWDTSPGWKLNRKVYALESAYAFGISNDSRLLATVSETDNAQTLALLHVRDLPSRKILQTIRLGIPEIITEAIQLGYSGRATIEDGHAVFSPDNSTLALSIVVSFPGISAHHGIVEFVLPQFSTAHRKTFLVYLNENRVQEASKTENEADTITNNLQSLFKKET